MNPSEREIIMNEKQAAIVNSVNRDRLEYAYSTDVAEQLKTMMPAEIADYLRGEQKTISATSNREMLEMLISNLNYDESNLESWTAAELEAVLKRVEKYLDII